MLKTKEDSKSITVTSQAWFTLGILSSTLLVVFFSETMLLPAIPEIMKDFRLPYALAAWLFSGYMIVAAVMTPIAGKLSDIYGKKKVLLILLIIYVAATAAGGFANNISFLLMTRLFQGVYMEDHSTIAGIQGSYPTLRSYDLVFLTSALLSGISIGFASVLSRRGAQNPIKQIRSLFNNVDVLRRKSSS